MTIDAATFKAFCVVTWFMGILVFCARMLDDQRRLRKLRQQSKLSCSESVESVANELMSTFRLKNFPCILESDQALTPMTWGILRPTVLFPNSFGSGLSLSNVRLSSRISHTFADAIYFGNFSSESSAFSFGFTRALGGSNANFTICAKTPATIL